MNSDRFRQAMRLYASGVCVVACGIGDDRRGMTVSAVSSVSAEPPLILVCINRSAASYGAIMGADRLTVNILRADDEDLAMVFASQSRPRATDKFDHGDWSCAGAPVLKTALQSLLCEPSARHDAGSHTILIGKVIELHGNGVGPAMVNFGGTLQGMPPLGPQAA